MRQPSKKIYPPELYKSLQGEDAVRERQGGRLPIIEIDNHLFFTEVRLSVLRPMDNFLSAGIDIEKGAVECEDGKHRLFCYHRSRMEDIDLKMAGPKDRLALVRIPSLLDLDPVMTAKMQSLPDSHYLKEHPMVMFRIADIVPLNLKQALQLADGEWEGIERFFNEEITKRNQPPKKRIHL